MRGLIKRIGVIIKIGINIIEAIRGSMGVSILRLPGELLLIGCILLKEGMGTNKVEGIRETREAMVTAGHIQGKGRREIMTDHINMIGIKVILTRIEKVIVDNLRRGIILVRGRVQGRIKTDIGVGIVIMVVGIMIISMIEDTILRADMRRILFTNRQQLIDR